MLKSFEEIEYPEDYQYASTKADYKPLRFYVDHLPRSVSLDIFLGYFSTSSLKLLSAEFANFIADGGYVRIIMNHFISDSDRGLFDSDCEGEILLFDEIVRNPATLRNVIENGGKHFFNCLKYLMRNGQLQIISVKYRGVEQSHVKKMILFDGKEYISTSGSVNFTASGLVRNSENLIVTAPWN